MTGVRWTRAEAEHAAAERAEAALLGEYPWHKYDGWHGEDAPEGAWPHLQHVVEVAAAAVLDALGITETVTVVAGHLEQVGWLCERLGFVRCTDGAPYATGMPHEGDEPVYRIVEP